jgi:hypothetical protein
MNAPFIDPAHSRLGGSVAARILRCPASVGLVEKVPEHLHRSSVYAERGTALHAAMALLLGDNPPPLESLVGEMISDYTITADDVENGLRPVLAYADALLDVPRAGFYLEHRVVFPTIAGAFGTVDLLVHIDNTVHVVDYKFGALRVPVLYPDGDQDVLSAQLMFYGASARHSLPEFFAGVKTIVLTIVQPMSIEPDAEMVSSVEVSDADLDQFIAVYRAACEEAGSESPCLARGDWCRFCAARPICPAHTAPLLDLAQFVVSTPGPAGGGAPSREAYLQALAAGLDLVDAIKDIRTALHDQAKLALQYGDVVPGYTLSAGRAERHWHDENAAIAVLTGLGLAHDDVVAETVRSPKQVELRAKVRGLKVPAELIGSHRSGVSLVRVENARAPVPGRGEIVRSFSRALETFLKEGVDDQSQTRPRKPQQPRQR